MGKEPSVMETSNVKGQRITFFFSLGTAFEIWRSVGPGQEDMIALGSRAQSILLTAVLADVFGLWGHLGHLFNQGHLLSEWRNWDLNSQKFGYKP